MMKNKSLLAIMASVLIAAFIHSTDLFGQGAAPNRGGDLTPAISWRIETRTLYLSGKGVVPTTMFGMKSAWHEYHPEFDAVVIEDGITGVGRFILNGYKNVTSLTVAGTVKDMAPSSFSYCKNLMAVEVKGATPPDISATVFYGVKFKKAVLTVPAGTRAAYEADPLWSQFRTIKESAQPADTQPAPVEKLAEPRKIHLTRSSNFVGGGRSVNVFLNGVEQSKLGNGSTVVMQTDRVGNELFIKQGKKGVAARRFDVVEGEDVSIEYSYFNGYMKVVGEDSDED